MPLDRRKPNIYRTARHRGIAMYSSDPYPDEEYEKSIMKESKNSGVISTEDQYYRVGYELDATSERELNPSTGAYTPAAGIYSLGWKAWEKLPAADFVKELQDWQLEFWKERSGDAFYPFFTSAIKNNELTTNQLRFVWREFFYRPDSIVHNYARSVAKAYPFREVQDIFARHVFEETGHSDMLADFLEVCLGVDRKELYLGRPTIKAVGNFADYWGEIFASGHFVEVAAALALYERELPKAFNVVARAMRKNYGFDGKGLIYFDVHRYIDIYHARFGQYIIAKYATTKELQDRARKTFEVVNNGSYGLFKAIYEGMPRR